MRRRIVVFLTALAAIGLSGCSADDDAGRASAGSFPTTAQPDPWTPSPTTSPVSEEEIPVAHDDGYADAVATFGEAQVQQAVQDDARIARIALADCWRWATGQMNFELTTLLSPVLMDRVEEELRRPPGWPLSLLANLPDDDGNGHDLAAAVSGGCDDSAPLHINVGTFNFDGPRLVLRVDRGGRQPALVVAGQYVMNVTLGDAHVSAGQDWQFTSVPDGAGWRLVDVTTGGAPVNWSLPLPT